MEVRLLSNRIEELVDVQFPGMYNLLGGYLQMLGDKMKVFQARRELPELLNMLPVYCMVQLNLGKRFRTASSGVNQTSNRGTRDPNSKGLGV